MDRITAAARRLALAALLLSVTGSLLIVPPTVRGATTYTVNSTADDDDFSCRPLTSGDCTLREAILDANSTPGKDTIAFAIPGSGVHTIRPETLLPSITNPVVIDGYTQPGATANTAKRGTNARLLIELDGSELGADNSTGLAIDAGNTTVRGLVINRFTAIGGGAIALRASAGNTGNVIEGNFLGTDPRGVTGQGNRWAVLVPLGQSTHNRIGGVAPAARNLISGNVVDGLLVETDNNEIVGNLFGTDRTGTKPLPNGRSAAGIVGSETAIIANVIAFNGGHGLIVVGSGNRIERNEIFANGGLGIDLGNDGPTANDGGSPPDGDSGANGLQNFPELIAVTTSERRTLIEGNLTSRRNTTFAIQFFANPATADAEGRRFLAEADVTTDDAGNATFRVILRGRKRVAAGQGITATATNEVTGDTSEFSAAAIVKRKR